MSTRRSNERLMRMLAMVPYLQANPGVSAAEAARDLGTTARQIMTDLNQLWMCGLPGYGPGDLIDLAFSEESITVTFSAGIDRPLRLTTDEAVTLLIALRALIDVPGVVSVEAARRALAKIEAAVGTSLVGSVITDADPTTEESESTRAVRSAVADDRALSLRYYSASRDVTTERVVDPVALQSVDGNAYLEAWCRTSAGIRLFRLDRIESATVLDEQAQRHQADSDDSMALFRDQPTLSTAEIDIDPEALWILDYYLIDPVDPDSLATSADGPVRARMAYGSPEWLTRFVHGFGGSVRLANSPEISAAVTHRAHEALRLYG